MYVPRTNAEDRPEILAAFMQAHPLAALISTGPDGQLWATHLPLAFHGDRGAHGVLEGHIARANPHHRLVTAAAERRAANDLPYESLAIFSGPDAYITPSWYVGKPIHGREVPTWNYIAVHVYGTLHVTDDRDWLHAHVSRLSDHHEAPQPKPWAVADAPDDYVEQQLHAIVGVELRITRIEARWKMSQNRSAEDIDGVIRGLRASDRPTDHVVASIVEERRPDDRR